MKKADVEVRARQDAEKAFKDRPNMDEIALRHYLVTDESKANIPRNGHTTYERVYLATYQELQEKG